MLKTWVESVTFSGGKKKYENVSKKKTTTLFSVLSCWQSSDNMPIQNKEKKNKLWQHADG